MAGDRIYSTVISAANLYSPSRNNHPLVFGNNLYQIQACLTNQTDVRSQPWPSMYWVRPRPPARRIRSRRRNYTTMTVNRKAERPRLNISASADSEYPQHMHFECQMQTWGYCSSSKVVNYFWPENQWNHVLSHDRQRGQRSQQLQEIRLEH